MKEKNGKKQTGKTVAVNLGKGFLIAFFIWIVLPLGVYIFLMGGIGTRTFEDRTAYAEAGGEQSVEQPVEQPAEQPAEQPIEQRVILGDEQYETYLPLLEGKRVALFSNHTGIVGDVADGEHILDALIARKVNVTAVFSPEHGFRGTEDAGAAVGNSVDEQTGVPIYSLYGGTSAKSLTAETMAQFDLLLIDIQDVGLRYYTYYLSMYDLMDACASHGKAVVLLDRPNPNGFYVDGPILQEEYHSGVGKLPIPIVHGMTLGELARMINGEGWLQAGKDACDLTVISCRNYTHQTKTALICNPSPNLKDMRAVYLYASTCFFENTLVSVGRGTDFPFELYGSPYLEGVPGNEFSFTPRSMAGAVQPPFLEQKCYGRDLRQVDLEKILERGIDLTYLTEAYRDVHAAHPEQDFFGKLDGKGRYWIDLLSGSDALRKMITEGKSPAEIKASWQEDIERFRTERAPYLLYAE